jgi:hypothetical protein
MSKGKNCQDVFTTVPVNVNMDSVDLEEGEVRLEPHVQFFQKRSRARFIFLVVVLPGIIIAALVTVSQNEVIGGNLFKGCLGKNKDTPQMTQSADNAILDENSSENIANLEIEVVDEVEKSEEKDEENSSIELDPLADERGQDEHSLALNSSDNEQDKVDMELVSLENEKNADEGLMELNSFNNEKGKEKGLMDTDPNYRSGLSKSKDCDNAYKTTGNDNYRDGYRGGHDNDKNDKNNGFD